MKRYIIFFPLAMILILSIFFVGMLVGVSVESTEENETIEPTIEEMVYPGYKPIKLPPKDSLMAVIAPEGFNTEPKKLTIEDIRTLEFEAIWHESAVYMAKTIWGEARGTDEDGQRKVCWCILNRVDSPEFEDTIIEVITAPDQFHGYSNSFPCTEEFYEMSMDIIANWQLEKMGGESNRNLESDYLFFCSDKTGLGNIFRKEW